MACAAEFVVAVDRRLMLWGELLRGLSNVRISQVHALAATQRKRD